MTATPIRYDAYKDEYVVAKLRSGKCWITQNLGMQNYEYKPDDAYTLYEYKTINYIFVTE